MLKFIFKLLLLSIAVVITLCVLYVFDLPPFQNIGPVQTNATVTDQQKAAAETKNLPANLQNDKVAVSKSYDEMIARAQLLEQNNFPTLAIAQYQEALTKDSVNFTPLYQIGKIYLRIGDYLKAESTFRDLTVKDPNNTDAAVYLGRSLLSQRKITEARDVFSKITANTQIVKYYQGIIAAYFGENDQSKNLLNQAVSLGGSDDITKKANNFLNAYNEYKFNIDAPDVHLKVLLARSFNQCGEYQMAIPLLFEVTKQKLDYRDAWILLGYAYLQTEKYPDAIEALERAKTLDPQSADALFYLGLGYYSMNNYQKAETNLTLAKQYGFQPVILVDQKLAEVYLQLQDFPKSADSYEKVLSLNSQDINYYVKPIWIYLEKTHQPDKALQLAEKAIKDHPNSAMGENLVGWTLIYNNDLIKAESHLKLAMALDPQLDATYLNLGLLFEKQNQPDKALVFYKKAHALGEGDGVSASAADRYNNLIAKLNNKSLEANTLQQ
jgi:tetratricopeptide (TPR) repeat protein